MHNRISILLSLLFLALTSFAQVPQGINYQTVIRNANGGIMSNTSDSIQFVIHKGSATGTIVYSETQFATTNLLGIVSLVIGQGTPTSGTFSNIQWSQGVEFLEVDIKPIGATSYLPMGTLQLMSVPYALYADSTREHQQLSLSGTQLSISGGNSVTLPSSGTSTPLFQQTVQIGEYASFVTATSEPGSSTFLAVTRYISSNNASSGTATIVSEDALTGSLLVTGSAGSSTNCGGNSNGGINGATTYQGGNYYSVSNGCGQFYETPSGQATFNIQPSGNGLMFSDGTNLYINNNTNWVRCTVSGSVINVIGTLTFSNAPTGISAVMSDGSNFYILNSSAGIIYKYDLTGMLLTSWNIPITAMGLVNIDATKLYLVSQTYLPSITASVNITCMTFTPLLNINLSK